VKPICHLRPAQATSVEKPAMSTLPTTMMTIACGTERPIAGNLSLELGSDQLLYVLKNVLGVCQFEMFKLPIAQ
jgi:hypothetical protein